MYIYIYIYVCDLSICLNVIFCYINNRYIIYIYKTGNYHRILRNGIKNYFNKYIVNPQ